MFSLLLPGYKIHYTKHALERMKERGIRREDVEEALQSPAQILYDLKRDVYLVMGENSTSVVYAVRGVKIEVVTVMRKEEYEALVRRLGNKRYKVIL